MSEKFKAAYDACQSKSRSFTIVNLTSYSPEALFTQVLEGLTTSLTTSLANTNGLG